MWWGGGDLFSSPAAFQIVQKIPAGSQSRTWQQLRALHTLPGNRPLELRTQEENKHTKNPGREAGGRERGGGGGHPPGELLASRTVESQRFLPGSGRLEKQLGARMIFLILEFPFLTTPTPAGVTAEVKSRSV